MSVYSTNIPRPDSVSRTEEGSRTCNVQRDPCRLKLLRTGAVVLDQDAILERKWSAARTALPVVERSGIQGQVPDLRRGRGWRGRGMVARRPDRGEHRRLGAAVAGPRQPGAADRAGRGDRPRRPARLRARPSRISPEPAGPRRSSTPSVRRAVASRTRWSAGDRRSRSLPPAVAC